MLGVWLWTEGVICLLVASVFSRVAVFPVHKDEPILDNLLLIVTMIVHLVPSGPPPLPAGRYSPTHHLQGSSTDSISPVSFH